MSKDVVLRDGEKEYDWNDVLYWLKRKGDKIAAQLIDSGWDPRFVNYALSRMIALRSQRNNIIQDILNLYESEELGRMIPGIPQIVGEQDLISEREALGEIQTNITEKLVRYKSSFEKMYYLVDDLYKDVDRRAINHLMNLGKKRFNDAAVQILGSQYFYENGIDLEKVEVI